MQEVPPVIPRTRPVYGGRFKALLHVGVLIISFVVGFAAFTAYMTSSPPNRTGAAYWAAVVAFGFGLHSCVHLLRTRQPILIVVAIASMALQSGAMFLVFLPPR
jgi:hypothetical protein